jgi:tRNA dimethylallyltransferase
MSIPPPLTGATPVPLIMGPTGAGKTDLALRLAANYPVEIVSVDSAMVYRGMDIGTGKPTTEERRRVRHHLIDVVDPGERYHAARFRRDALEAIRAIRSRGRLPAVVGGTGLYVRALLKGLAPAPPADPALRAELEAEAARHGAAQIHARLERLDAVAARRLHPRDLVRVIRAIEVRVAGRAPAGAPGAGDWRGASRFRLLMVGLAQERRRLNQRLAERVREMLARGMMDEVRDLMASGHDEGAAGMATIGYRQLAAVARGQLALDEAEGLMVRDTTRYAKRQMTWFARDAEIRWLDVDAVGGGVGAAAQVAAWAREDELIG